MNQVASRHDVVVVGAGLVGSLLALGLKKRGHDVAVYERRPDPRKTGAIGGRSINLALSDRGLLALERAGVQADVEKVAISMPGRRMHAIDGSTSFMPYGLNGEAIRSVSRGGLNERLVELVEAAGVPVHFGHRCDDVDLNATRLRFANDDGFVDVDAAVIAGADGAYSAVRQAFLRKDRFEYSQSYLDHGYKELSIPPGKNGAFQLDQHALHIWPRSAYMLIALPNLDGSFTCTLFLAFDGPLESFAALNTLEKASAFFAHQFPDAMALMPDFAEQWAANPVASLVTVRCAPWVQQRTLLIGDASHAIVPFFGQGMNAGFEDVRVLLDLLDAHNNAWDTVLPAFAMARKEDADAIATLAVENFVEMRDKVGQPAFLFRKKVEAAFARTCPDAITPAYTMVTFRPHLPYREALARSRRLDAVLDVLCADADVRAHVDGNENAAALRAFEDAAARLTAA